MLVTGEQPGGRADDEEVTVLCPQGKSPVGEAVTWRRVQTGDDGVDELGGEAEQRPMKPFSESACRSSTFRA